MNTWLQRRRQQIAWFCAAVALWMPWDAQLHGLWHARQAVHEAALIVAALPPAANHVALTQASRSGALPHSAQVCEQCLLFSVLDAALPSHALDLPTVAEAPASPMLIVRQWSAAPFTAYLSRAPPRRA